ncbi:MAG: nucleotide sugar dehydrogenase [Candidatus Levybacteria bacterium]|nr:nucleotide sugar dehydrogenase [Candidatus Levybacteria bacterium]
MRNYQKLLNKIEKKQVKIAIIGLGYVGLPLAIFFAKRGFTVRGYTSTKTTASLINQGSCNVTGYETRLKKILQEKNFTANALSDTTLDDNDVYIICVPTPLKKNNKPDLSILQTVAKRLSRMHPANRLIINESTVAPMTTKELLGSLACDSFLVCSPERIDPGSNMTAENIPKVIGGIDTESLELGVTLYKQILKKPMITVNDMETAELSKMLENTYRAVNIALINEFAKLADNLGIDILEAINAAKTKWSFQAHFPSIGVGGHCIKVDPYYILELANKKQIPMKVVTDGLVENESMPTYVLEKVKKYYKRGMHVLVYGITYKKNVADLRESPVISFCNLLRQHMIDFSVYDPIVDAKKIEQMGFTIGRRKQADIFIVGTDHKTIARDYKHIVSKDTVVIDGRNYFQSKVGKKVIGIGRKIE